MHLLPLPLDEISAPPPQHLSPGTAREETAIAQETLFHLSARETFLIVPPSLPPISGALTCNEMRPRDDLLALAASDLFEDRQLVVRVHLKGRSAQLLSMRDMNN
jgi:hypothetical protein